MSICAALEERDQVQVFSEPYRGGHWVKRYCGVGLIFMARYTVFRDRFGRLYSVKKILR